MTHGRAQRIESEIQRVLSALIAREVKDPRVGNVTVTAVSVAPDMGRARVFFTPFASLHPPDEVRAGLTRAAGFLRGSSGGAWGCGTRRGSSSCSMRVSKAPHASPT